MKTLTPLNIIPSLVSSVAWTLNENEECYLIKQQLDGDFIHGEVRQYDRFVGEHVTGYVSCWGSHYNTPEQAQNEITNSYAKVWVFDNDEERDAFWLTHISKTF